MPVGEPVASRRLRVVFLCTGNAARSVMAGAALVRCAPGVDVVTAGTHVIEGQPTSRRTRDALATVGLTVDSHRSRQLRDADLEHADVVVGFAREHVAYVRRTHPDAAPRTATLRRLCRDLPRGSGPVAERIAGLRLDEVELEPWEDVADPAGGDEEVFDTCAREVVELVGRLVDALGPIR